MSDTLGKIYLEELEAEVPASRHCLERVPTALFGWKPHERSMQMGYLAEIVADIPRWITTAVEEGEVNFGTFKREEPRTTDDLLRQFDKNMAHAREVLGAVPDGAFAKTFSLKNGETVLMSDTIMNTVSSSINHLVHHRGQLTVYLRLNDIPVPKIYGPSADDKAF